MYKKHDQKYLFALARHRGSLLVSWGRKKLKQQSRPQSVSPAIWLHASELIRGDIVIESSHSALYQEITFVK